MTTENNPFLGDDGRPNSYEDFLKKMQKMSEAEHKKYCMLVEWYNLVLFKGFSWYYQYSDYDKEFENWLDNHYKNLENSADKNQFINLLIEENELSNADLRNRGKHTEQTVGYEIAIKGQFSTFDVFHVLSLCAYEDPDPPKKIIPIEEYQAWKHETKHLLTIANYLKNVCLGYNRALKVKFLKDVVNKEHELPPLVKTDVEEMMNTDIPDLKLKWTGTPGEFGAIMGELINNGFIPKIKDLKNTVRILNSVFEVRNEQGEIVKDDYLYKCFGEKKRTYFPNEFKLPLSDNINKPK